MIHVGGPQTHKVRSFFLELFAAGESSQSGREVYANTNGLFSINFDFAKAKRKAIF